MNAYAQYEDNYNMDMTTLLFFNKLSNKTSENTVTLHMGITFQCRVISNMFLLL